MNKAKYNFNEKEKEFIGGQELQVWQSPNYLNSKQKVIEILESKKYDLVESDFWILMNKTKTGKVAYTGLIISHNGCLKINDKLENKVDPTKFTIDKTGYRDSLVIQYVDNEVCEFGEYSSSNCQNAYPYAMAYKRCFDRVVLKKSKLAYSGVYSDSEAEEFKNKQEDNLIDNANKLQSLRELLINYDVEEKSVTDKFKVNTLSDLTNEQLEEAFNTMMTWIDKNKKGNN